MTTGQGAEVHINHAADLSRGMGLMQPMRTQQRILKPERERQALTVTGSTNRHAVALDTHVNRPVHQEIHCPNPSVYNRHAVPNLGCPQAESGQNVAYVTGSTLIVRNFTHARHGETVPVFGNVFSYCTGSPSSQGGAV